MTARLPPLSADAMIAVRARACCPRYVIEWGNHRVQVFEKKGAPCGARARARTHACMMQASLIYFGGRWRTYR